MDNKKFTNELGVTWEKNDMCSDYKGHAIWLCTFPEGYQSYVIVKDGKVLGESQQIESICCRIDALTF